MTSKELIQTLYFDIQHHFPDRKLETFYVPDFFFYDLFGNYHGYDKLSFFDYIGNNISINIHNNYIKPSVNNYVGGYFNEFIMHDDFIFAYREDCGRIAVYDVRDEASLKNIPLTIQNDLGIAKFEAKECVCDSRDLFWFGCRCKNKKETK